MFDDASREFRLRATYGMDDTVIAEIRDRHIHLGETAIGRAVEQRMPVQVPDIQSDPSAVLDVIVRAGFRALLTVPLLGADRIVGALVVRRKEPGDAAVVLVVAAAMAPPTARAEDVITLHRLSAALASEAVTEAVAKLRIGYGLVVDLWCGS